MMWRITPMSVVSVAWWVRSESMLLLFLAMMVVVREGWVNEEDEWGERKKEGGKERMQASCSV